MFFSRFKCCNPKKESCSRDDLREAMQHAKERADKTGKNQSTIYKDGKWVTTTIGS